MNKLIDFAKLVALLSFAFICIAGGVAALSVNRAVKHGDAKVTQIGDKAVAMLDTINRPCGVKGQPCGTLANVSKVLDKGGDAMVQMQIMARTEGDFAAKTLPQLSAHVQTSMDGVDHATSASTLLLNETTARVHDLAKLEGTANQFVADLDGESDMLLTSANGTLVRVNGLVANPEIPRILTNVNGMTDSLNGMLATGRAVEDKATHGYLHPSHNPFVRTWQVASPFALPAAQIGAALIP